VVVSEVYRGDCLEVLPTLPAERVQLVLTSPPYNIGWDYAGRDNDRQPLSDYLALLEGFVAGAERILASGGVLAVNLPQTIRVYDSPNGHRRRPKPPIPGKTYRNKPPKDALVHRSYPVAAWLMMHLTQTGWLLREPIVWVKSMVKQVADEFYNAGQVYVRATSTAIGAHSNPCLRPCHEMVLVASKDTYRIPNRDHRWPGESSAFGGHLELCKDVWPLGPGQAKAGEPLAFPDELVSRLVLLYSNPGDVVLDPFAGNGTTGRVARLHGREAWLIEREPAYWPRLETVLGQGVMNFGVPA
jgi:DNA modification methylase